jgi:hypothetical protein
MRSCIVFSNVICISSNSQLLVQIEAGEEMCCEHVRPRNKGVTMQRIKSAPDVPTVHPTCLHYVQ